MVGAATSVGRRHTKGIPADIPLREAALGYGWNVSSRRSPLSAVPLDPLNQVVKLGVESINLAREFGYICLITRRLLHKQRHLRPIDRDVDPFALRYPKCALALRLVLGREIILEQEFDQQ